MTNELENSGAGTQRTRRNLMKMGAILVPATLGKIHSAAAKPVCDTPFPIINLVCDIVTGNPPGNGGKTGGGGGGHVNCFLKGTKIRTAKGERKIEELTMGDLLQTVFGGLRPIQWIGRYPFKKSDPSKPWAKDALPVRIARSALAPNVPHADLYVTASHSLLIDGALVPAELLINGTTITRYAAHEHQELEYFHIKLESHDVVYAQGAPAETLLKVEDTAVNFAEYFRRHGTPVEDRCAPHVDVWGGRDEFMSRFRSALSPWIDLRNRAEVIRDRLEEHGYVSCPEPEIVG